MFHLTVSDLTHLLSPFGVKFLTRSLCISGHEDDWSCTDPTMTPNNLTLTDDYLRSLVTHFEQDSTLLHVTHIVCFRPCLVCKFLDRLNKPLIIIASNRYEEGVDTVKDWQYWNLFLQDMEVISGNVVAANNHYDMEYMRYYTGVNPMYLPNACSYIRHMYEPSGNVFAVAPMDSDKKMSKWFLETLRAALEKRNFLGGVPKVEYCDSLFMTLSNEEISKYRAIIYVPQQVSIMNMCQHYQLGVPIFVPSLELLTTWHVDYGVVNDKTLPRTKRFIKNKHIIPTSIPGASKHFYPNDDLDANNIRFWLRFADFYQWPHILQYESFDHLVYQMQSTNLRHVSNEMQEHSSTLVYDLQVKWTEILSKK